MEKILKGYVFRMYPTEEQKILIEKSIGTSRFIYNHFLNVLPPAYWNNGILQVGEPADTFGGKFTFSTFTKVNNRFFYNE